MNPRRVDGLEINPVEDGYMVYQPERERVHYLNHTAVLVLELSDGQRSADDIADLVKEVFSLPERPRKEVDETLAQMIAEGLVEAKVEQKAGKAAVKKPVGRARTRGGSARGAKKRG